jgi:ActR/RegA family two-component response regulator
LFVDDEPNIRLTLPAILQMHNFEVTAVDSVAAALSKMNEHKFDVLIADLNIGEPGDGFTVVSAMRRTQPEAVTIIMTGFPAFETALEAIRSQVDDYVVKPANVDRLVNVIQRKLDDHTPHRPLPSRSTASILRANKEEVIQRWLEAAKGLRQPPVEEKVLREHATRALDELIDRLERHRGAPSPDVPVIATQFARSRKAAGSPLPMLLEELRLLREIISGVLQENLLAVDLSNVINDMIEISSCLDTQLSHIVAAYSEAA